MIRERKALSMAESLEFVSGEKEKEVKGFIKKFTSTKTDDAKKLREKIEKLDFVKIDEGDISKIIDLLPQNHEELNKITPGISFDEEEGKKILDVVKEYA